MKPSFDTVDLLDGNVFQVTWDLGRRCNYDCSYCPSHRHDNFSSHATLEDLKKNADFVFKYIDLYMTYRDYKRASINFTGGEPTVNPNFIEFAEYFRKKYDEEYANKWECAFTLTSNGAMGKKIANSVLENFNHITISYHAEADVTIKEQVKRRIIQFSKEGPAHDANISINVMFHAAYFDECKELCSFLDDNNIKYVPRIIGEEPDSKSNFAHQYTDDQLQWFKDYWNDNTKKVQAV
jgi:sulfatase maturation enzyme AslB (radical SAM superfamily)